MTITTEEASVTALWFKTGSRLIQGAIRRAVILKCNPDEVP